MWTHLAKMPEQALWSHLEHKHTDEFLKLKDTWTWRVAANTMAENRQLRNILETKSVTERSKTQHT